MNDHWAEGVCIKDLLDRYKPSTVLELGASAGSCTIKLLRHAYNMNYELVTVDDGPPNRRVLELLKYYGDSRRGEGGQPMNYKWVRGISYVEVGKLKPSSVDFCLIDTDHNAWTVNKEIEELTPIMSARSILAFHDTEINRFNNGVYERYKTNHDYPRDEIAADTRTYTEAVVSGMEDGWDLLCKSPENAGAMVFQRKAA
jgi:predicted O-methyltransferase YrrM